MFTVLPHSPPKNTQNDHLYIPSTMKKKHASVGVSKLGFNYVIFVDPGTKIYGVYSRDVFLSQQLLPVVRDAMTASLYTGHSTLLILQQTTSAFIPPDLWPPNSRDLNPVHYEESSRK